MPDIAAVLKQEISRLARKEIKAVAGGHSKQIQALKAAVSDLRDRVATLEKALSKGLAVASQPSSTPESEDEQRELSESAPRLSESTGNGSDYRRLSWHNYLELALQQSSSGSLGDQLHEGRTGEISPNYGAWEFEM